MDVYIHSACRTPLGAFGGGMRRLGVIGLAAAACRGAVARTGMDPSRVDEVVLGSALSVGADPLLASGVLEQAGLQAGTPACVVSQSGGAGLMAIDLAMRAILSGAAERVVAGGVECLSGVPYLLPDARWGRRLGATTIVDPLCGGGGPWEMAQHGPETGHGPARTGTPADSASEESWASGSRAKALAAQAEGLFKREIVPVAIPSRGSWHMLAGDEYLAPGEPGGLPGSAPALGFFAAAGCSPPADGAAAIVLAGQAALDSRPIGRILGLAKAGLERAPGASSALALSRLLERARLAHRDIDSWEIDEVTASGSLAIVQALRGIDPGRLNRRGGSLALGHPMGAAGVRMLVTLLHVLESRGERLGVVLLGAAGDQGMAILMEHLG